MIILPNRFEPKYKTLMPVKMNTWLSPSQSQVKDDMGNSDCTSFRLRAIDCKGNCVWIGHFSDRQDFDAVLTAILDGSIRKQKALWKLSTPEWSSDIPTNVFYEPKVIKYLSNYAGQAQEFVIPEDWTQPLQAPTLYIENELQFWSGTLAFITSGTSDTAPSLFRAVQNSFECIGGGGQGAKIYRTDYNGTTGGGGGAYSRTDNLNVSGGATVYYSIGAGSGRRSINGAGTAGGDTWINRLVNSAPTVTANGVVAKGGSGGLFGSGILANAAGGLASSGVGTIKYNGGDGGGTLVAADHCSSGGGGAAGPQGSGISSPKSPYGSATSGAAGGAGFGGAGGIAPGNNPGGNGTEWTVSFGSGGGGAGSSNNSARSWSGGGGNYGGAGGSASGYNNSDVQSGGGVQGLLVISYTPFVPGFTMAAGGL